MKHILNTALFCFVLLTSCEERDASGPGTMVTKRVTVTVTTPVDTPSTTTTTPGPVPASNVVATTASQKLNPAHGQPGHRCDVAVGAPLTGGPAQNAKPASPAINPAVQTAPTLQTTPTTPSVTTATVAP